MQRRSEFFQVKQTGKKSVGKYLLVSYASDEDLPHLKVGFILTTKIANAVKRNQIRRQLKAILTSQLSLLIHHQGRLVTIGRHTAQSVNFSKLQADYLNQLKSLSLL